MRRDREPRPTGTRHQLAPAAAGDRLFRSPCRRSRRASSPARRSCIGWARSLLERRWAGGDAGHEDRELATARFREPLGLSLAGPRLYVADTNSHAVRLVDVAVGTVRTLRIATG